MFFSLLICLEAVPEDTSEWNPDTAPHAIVMLVAAVALGLYFPMYLTRETWHILIFIYILIASVAPVTILIQLHMQLLQTELGTYNFHLH